MDANSYVPPDELRLVPLVDFTKQETATQRAIRELQALSFTLSDMRHGVKPHYRPIAMQNWLHDWRFYCLERNTQRWPDGKFYLLDRQYRPWRRHQVCGYTENQLVNYAPLNSWQRRIGYKREDRLFMLIVDDCRPSKDDLLKLSHVALYLSHLLEYMSEPEKFADLSAQEHAWRA